MTDVGKEVRAKLTEIGYVGAPKTRMDKAATDGTHKWLLGMDKGNAVETVYIPEPTRGTLCVSSQIGCALNCQFCSTGAQGFNRNLSTAEIIGQVWVAAKYLGNVTHQNRRITNVVMMGMGEPLANFEPVVRAMKLMRDDLGFGLAAKRVTLSTAGMVPMIDLLSAEIDVSLAVSLHAANDELRTELVPLNKRYPIADLLAAGLLYAIDMSILESVGSSQAPDGSVRFFPAKLTLLATGFAESAVAVAQAVHHIRPDMKLQPAYSTNTGVPGGTPGQP